MRTGIVGGGTIGGRRAQRIAAGELGSSATIAGVADLDTRILVALHRSLASGAVEPV